MDYTDKHNTFLNPFMEAIFQMKLSKSPRRFDLYDYDLRGAYQELGDSVFGRNGHLPDTYKKPNHPTFSNESIYNSVPGEESGSWINYLGNDYFKPGYSNIRNFGNSLPKAVQAQGDSLAPGRILELLKKIYK